MSRLSDEIIQVLKRYVSPMRAEMMLQRGVSSTGLDPANLAPRQVSQFAKSLETSIRLFVPEDQQDPLRRELLALSTSNTSLPVELPRKSILMVRDEGDISTARNHCRRLANELRMNSFSIQKATTIVSELARNIATYSVGGRMELEPMNSYKIKLVIRAIDQGPGISNLPEILSGKYRSRTGMGLGILGVKRLADDFDIKTAPSGTHVEAVVFA